MDAEEARELALNARLDHWPAHLGVVTGEQKIEYLATKLDEAATNMFNGEALLDQNEALREENEHYKNWYGGETPELNDNAAKNPEQLPETEEELLLRERAKSLYMNSAVGVNHARDDYNAGWVTAKAHYEPKQ